MSKRSYREDEERRQVDDERRQTKTGDEGLDSKRRRPDPRSRRREDVSRRDLRHGDNRRQEERSRRGNEVIEERSDREDERRQRKTDEDDLDSKRRRIQQDPRQGFTSKDKEEEKMNDQKNPQKQNKDDFMTRTGGAYIPPGRLKLMQEGITDKDGAQYQRLSWEALKKSINGLVNKVNAANITDIIRELFQENLVRGRGLIVKSLMTAQAASAMYTNVYCALAAIINTKFPQIGDLLLRRLVIQFKKSFLRSDKQVCLNSCIFIAHLVNQEVAHEIVALEMLMLLLHNPTDDSVEIAIGFLKECGAKLQTVSNKAVVGVFERLRNVLHEATIDKRTQYMIEVMFAVRKDGFKDHPAVPAELDLVEEDDQFTHLVHLEDKMKTEDLLNIFKFDPDFQTNEQKYKELKEQILGESGSESGCGDGSSSEEEEQEETTATEGGQQILDMTETNLVGFRRTVYLTIQSSLDFEECVHKLMKMQVKPGWEKELCNMVLDCCSQQRTYEKFYGLLAQRFCMLEKRYINPFQQIFVEQYETCHNLETSKLRNVAKLFGHLLYTDAISWEVFCVVKINEDDTTSSGRIFLKILFQELSEYMGLTKLNDRLCDQTIQSYFEGIKPRTSPRDLRFAINFFTSIGLGCLTDDMRSHLEAMPKHTAMKKVDIDSTSSSSSDSESDSSSDTSSSSSSSTSASEKENRKVLLKKRQKEETKRPGDGEESARERLRKMVDREATRSGEHDEDGRTRGRNERQGSDRIARGPERREDAQRDGDARGRDRYRGEPPQRTRSDEGERTSKDGGRSRMDKGDRGEASRDEDRGVRTRGRRELDEEQSRGDGERQRRGRKENADGESRDAGKKRKRRDSGDVTEDSRDRSRGSRHRKHGSDVNDDSGDRRREAGRKSVDSEDDQTDKYREKTREKDRRSDHEERTQKRQRGSKHDKYTRT